MKRARCGWFLIGVLFFAMVARGADTETKRPDLNGVVQSTNGQAVAGASVFIYTAGPKVGVGFL
jgi:hypothetical protein